MTFKTPLIASMVSLMALTACVDPNNYANDPTARQRQGAIMGGVAGALVGASSSNDRIEKAAIGGVLGALAGGAIGATLDQQAAELRGSINNPNISITNHGDYLTVNMPQDLLFAIDSASLRPDLRSDLGAVASSLLRYPNSRIEVVGHTDNTGSAQHNYQLSQRRAASVAGVLTGNGVPSNRVSIYGRGFDQPIASNATDAGRAQNRRVEIIIRPTQ